MHQSDPIDQDEGSQGLYGDLSKDLYRKGRTDRYGRNDQGKIVENDTPTQLRALPGERSWAYRAVQGAVKGAAQKAKVLTQHTSVTVSLGVILAGAGSVFWWEHCRIDGAEAGAGTAATEIQIMKSEQQGTVKAVDERFDGVDARFNAVDQRFDRVEKQLDKMEQKIDQNQRDMNSRLAEIMALLVKQHSQLEKSVPKSGGGPSTGTVAGPVMDGLGRVGIDGANVTP